MCSFRRCLVPAVWESPGAPGRSGASGPSISDGVRTDMDGNVWCSVGWGDPNENGMRGSACPALSCNTGKEAGVRRRPLPLTPGAARVDGMFTEISARDLMQPGLSVYLHVLSGRAVRASLSVLLAAACAAFPPLASSHTRASAHGAHEHFAFGEPGDPKKPFRVVKVTMFEDAKKMLFEPNLLQVRLGEQIRFEIFNEGTWTHEFVLATETENRKHAELMKKFPAMEHKDPNALRLSPFALGSLLWKFTKRGAFEYACLIPGHLEAGMHGMVIVN